MYVLGLLIFITLQIIFIPLAIIGIAVSAYQQISVSKKLGVSMTAIEILTGRWHMHWFGLREDLPTDQLSRVLPNNSVFGHFVTLFPLFLFFKISGKRIHPVIAEKGEEAMTNIVPNRTVYFDELTNKNIDISGQFVVLGAGLDTRSYGLLKESNLKLFELDQATTQQFKIEHLRKANIDTSRVTFVESDFAKDDWFQQLEDAGYDCTLKTVFLWEGVTLYLSESEVRKTLQTIKTRSAGGSVVLTDIYDLSFLQFINKGSKVLEATNESLGGFGLHFSEEHDKALSDFIASENATPGGNYFMGEKTKKGAWMVVTEIIF